MDWIEYNKDSSLDAGTKYYVKFADGTIGKLMYLGDSEGFDLQAEPLHIQVTHYSTEEVVY